MVQTVQLVNAPQVGRTSRRPKHPFHLEDVRPWQIQPMMIAPVLPGETLDNLLLQSRVVTDPLANKLIGWWCEYYFFYVKHRDLNDRDAMVEMMLDPSYDASALDAATQAKHFHLNGTPSPAIDWVKLCMDRVVEEYFRNEGETVTGFQLDNLPIANLSNLNWTDSFGTSAAIDDAGDQDLTSIVAGQGDGTAAVMTSEISAAMQQYEFLRHNNLIDMTYEDYLASYGVRQAAQEDSHKPELIRFIRDWTYPTNTIDPTDGSASTAASWSLTERADKKRFFKEPGFIVGYQVVRPKIYLADHRSSVTSLMASAADWLPAVMSDDPWSSIRGVDGAAPPVPAHATDYLFDIKDLLLYGEQFLNFDPGPTNALGCVITDTTAGSEYRYGTSAAADSLFAAIAPANKITSDGIVSLNIKGTQIDTSPTSVGSRAGL